MNVVVGNTSDPNNLTKTKIKWIEFNRIHLTTLLKTNTFHLQHTFKCIKKGTHYDEHYYRPITFLQYFYNSTKELHSVPQPLTLFRLQQQPAHYILQDGAPVTLPLISC